jgi:hypothetical protein
MSDRTNASALNRSNASERSFQAIQRRSIQVPSRFGRSGPGPVLHVMLIGGNELDSGQDGLIYAATVTPAAVYDPEVDTTFPDGLARGWLFVDGVRQAERVLIRHDFIGHTGAFIGGTHLSVTGTTTLTYDDTPMTCYTIGWP